MQQRKERGHVLILIANVKDLYSVQDIINVGVDIKVFRTSNCF